jgi:tetratricopeptide (TPR) repeat protein
VRELNQAGDSGDLLWLAADGFMQARLFDQAEAILELGLRGEFPPQRQSEARMALAETLLAQGKREPAARLLRQCAGQPGPQQMRAKYLLALVLIDLGEYDEAEVHLKEVVTAPALGATADLPRLARFALVHVLFRREAFAEAADYLEKAVTDDHQPQTIATRYWLAEAHRRAARQETRGIAVSEGGTAREFYLKRKQERLGKAIEQFDRVIADLRTARQRGDLAGEELIRLRECRVGRAECLMLLGRYDEAIADLTRFLQEEPPSVSSLTAAMYLTQGHLAQQRLELAQESARRGRQILDQLSNEDLASARTSRRVWQEWFDRAAALHRHSEGP